MKSISDGAGNNKGYTKLDNETDMALLMSLPTGLVKPALLLMQRRNLQNPVVTVEMVMEFCGVEKRRAYVAMSQLSCALKCTGGWVFSAQKCTNECTKVHKTVHKSAQTPIEKPVQNEENDTPKEVEVKKRELKPILNTHYVGEGLEETPKTQTPKPVPPFSEPTLSAAVVTSDPSSANQTTSSQLQPKPPTPDPLAELTGEVGLFLRKKLEASPGKLAVWLPKAIWFQQNTDLQTLKALWSYCHKTAESSPGSMFFAFAKADQALPEAVRLQLASIPAPAQNPVPDGWKVGDFVIWKGAPVEVIDVGKPTGNTARWLQLDNGEAILKDKAVRYELSGALAS